MQDRQNNLSTSSFKYKQKVLLKYAFVFFTPVVILYILIELLVLTMPANYKTRSRYFNNNKETIELIALGSSEMAGAINPEYLDIPSICLASSSQHHGLDFAILTQLQPEIKNLKYVVLELSTSHLELPHNSKHFWKNAVYLKYFNVNAFKRITYFKDKLIYLANPDLYSEKLMNHYVLHTKEEKLNKFGFGLNDSESIFKKHNFNIIEIDKLKTHPNQKESPEIFKYNTEFLYGMLDYLKEKNIQPIICSLPLYKTYRKNLNTNIVRRRDSVIKIIKTKYPEVLFINAEKDATFTVSDFANANHLNPEGARKFSEKLNTIINQLD